MITENPTPYLVNGWLWQDPTDWSTETADGEWYAELETEGRWRDCWTLSRRQGIDRVSYGLYGNKDKAQAAARKYAAEEQASIDAVLSLIPASGQRPEDVSGEMAARIKALIREYEGCTTVAATIGVLQIVGYELLRDQDE